MYRKWPFSRIKIHFGTTPVSTDYQKVKVCMCVESGHFYRIKIHTYCFRVAKIAERIRVVYNKIADFNLQFESPYFHHKPFINGNKNEILPYLLR